MTLKRLMKSLRRVSMKIKLNRDDLVKNKGNVPISTIANEIQLNESQRKSLNELMLDLLLNSKSPSGLFFSSGDDHEKS